MRMVVAVGTMAVPASMVIDPRVVVVGVAVSIDRPAGRGHDHGVNAMARCHHDRRGIAKNHPRNRWQRNANTDVYTCLGSRSRSEKNRCQHK